MQPLPKATVVGTLAVVVLLGLFLRASNLGGPDFSEDEILHVFAAQELVKGNDARLPSGVPNPRGLAYTYSVALSGWLWGVDEWSARVPGVLFGTLTIVMVFVMARRWYSASAALVAAFLTAVDPAQLGYSRQVRMYALFQLVYLAFIFLFFEAFERAPDVPGSRLLQKISSMARAIEIRPSLIPVVGVLFFFGSSLQALMLAAAVGPVAYAMCMTAVSSISTATPRPVKLKYAVSVLLVVLVIVAASVLTDVPRDAWQLAQYVPEWARGSAGHWRFYVWELTELHPIMFGTFGLAGIYAATRNFKATLYVLACFTATLLLHSFLAWKHLRYILHILPLLFILFGVAFSAIITSLAEVVARWALELRSSPRTAKVAGMSMSFAAGLFLLASMGEFRQGIKLHRLDEGEFVGLERRNWKNAMRFLDEHGAADDVVVTRVPGLAKYYAPSRVVYCLDGITLQQALEDQPPLVDREGRLIEYVAGTPIIADSTMLQDIMNRHPVGWFVVEKGRFDNPAVVPDDVRQLIERNFQQQKVPLASDMAVWKWNTARLKSES